MAFDLDSIHQGISFRPPRIVLLGTEKIGKSTFAAGSHEPIFIPIKGEEGIDAIDVPQFPTSNSLGDVMKCIDTLARSEHSFGSVVVDSSSMLEPLVWDNTCARNDHVDGIAKVLGGYGNGYTEALTDWRILTSSLDVLRTHRNMVSILIGHVKVKRFDDPSGPSYDQYQWDIHEKAASLLTRWADSVLFCNTKTVVKTTTKFGKDIGKGRDISGDRFLYTQKRPAHPGGGRGVFGQLPYELPLSWAAFQGAIVNASQKKS